MNSTTTFAEYEAMVVKAMENFGAFPETARKLAAECGNYLAGGWDMGLKPHHAADRILRGHRGTGPSKADQVFPRWTGKIVPLGECGK